MIQRCENPKNKGFPNYGARGISVCEAWQTFENFYSWALWAGWELGLDLDRKDNDLGYTPENCRFVTKLVSRRNRRCVLQVVAFGETKTLQEWAEDSRCSIGRDAIRARINAGWDSEAAITSPSGLEALKIRVAAFGEIKTIAQWVKDPRCACRHKLLEERIRLGKDPEWSIETPSCGAFGTGKNQ